MIEHTSLEERITARLLLPEAREMDAGLPEWARRTNPIVRRELGIYWKLMPPNTAALARFTVIQLILIGASLFIPFLLTLMIPAATVSLVALPIAFVLFLFAYFRIGALAASSMSRERENDTLDLLRVCPRPLREVLFSKAAAAVWRQIENLGVILVIVTLCSLPLLVILSDRWFDGATQPVLMRVGVGLGLVVSVVRVALEAGLAAAIGVAVGSTTRHRVSATVATSVALVAYLAAINLVRLPPWGVEMRMLIEFVLPVVAPIVLMAICFRIAARAIEGP